jgi:hypothetical protein
MHVRQVLQTELYLQASSSYLAYELLTVLQLGILLWIAFFLTQCLAIKLFSLDYSNLMILLFCLPSSGITGVHHPTWWCYEWLCG